MTDYSKIAYKNVNKKFSISEANNDDIIKSAVLLNLNEIDEDLAELIIFNLTNHSGPVRELSAYRLCEIIKDYKQYFQSKKTLDIIISALNDVNPNVVRFILQTLGYLDDKKYLFDNLLTKVSDLYKEILNKPRRGKEQEHIFTKKCFKIYWSLESIKQLVSLDRSLIYTESKIREDFYNILKDLTKIEEYTIREKIAQIVNILHDEKLFDIKIKLCNDENYFVKRIKNENISC